MKRLSPSTSSLVAASLTLLLGVALSSCASSTFKDEGSYTIGAPPEKDRGEIHGSLGAGAAFSSDGRNSQWTGGEVYYTKRNFAVGVAAVQESEL